MKCTRSGVMRTNNETPKGVFLFPRKSVGPGAKLVRQNGCIVMYQIANQIQKSVTGEQFLWNLPNKLFPVPSVPEKKTFLFGKKKYKK